MGGLNVKNTIVERALQVIAPHYCLGCGKVGSLLCSYCKYNIGEEPFLGCIICGLPSRSGICSVHDSTLERSFIVSERSGVLEATINGLKFHNSKAAAKELAILLDQRLPLLPTNTLIVPIPTVRSHIRQRGYDQVELIARHLSNMRGISIAPLLKRVGTATQHELGKEERRVAAQKAFTLNRMLSVQEGILLLVLDDIITTAATVSAAAETLKPLKGIVMVGALAYQPLD